MRKFEDFIFKCVERALSRRQPHRIGEVSSYDPKTHAIKLTRQPEGIETGFMPHHALHVGNGWGVMVGAQVGDQYVLGHVNGDVEVPFVAARIFSDKDKPPQVKAGEILFQHEKTNKVFFDQDGNLNIVGSAGAKQVVTLAKDGSVTVGDSGGATIVLKTGTILSTDKKGGQVYQENGNVHLGSKDTTNPVSTVAGPSTHVFAIV